MAHEVDEVRDVAHQEEDEASQAFFPVRISHLTFLCSQQVDSPAVAHQEVEASLPFLPVHIIRLTSLRNGQVDSRAVEEHQVVVGVSQAEVDHRSVAHPVDEVASRAVAEDSRQALCLFSFFSFTSFRMLPFGSVAGVPEVPCNRGLYHIHIDDVRTLMRSSWLSRIIKSHPVIAFSRRG